MKKSMCSFLLLCVVVLISFSNLYSIELGRGVVESNPENTFSIRKLDDGKVISIVADQSSEIDLISGQTVPFSVGILKEKMTVEYIIDGTASPFTLISISIDFGGKLGEYLVVGGLDFYNLTSKTCRVNGTRFKFSPTILFQSRGENVSPNVIQNTDLVRVLYTKDPINDQNIAETIEVIGGTFHEVKRTGVVRSFTINELVIGDPVKTDLQEKIIVSSQTRIYDDNFKSGSRSLLKPGTLVDIYAFYDTNVVSASLAYEIHAKPLPMFDDLYICGRPLSVTAGWTDSELGRFNLLPNAKFADFSGDGITLSELLQGEARYFSAKVKKTGVDYNYTAVKEIPSIQTEFSFDGDIIINSQYSNLALVNVSGESVGLELNSDKIFYNGLTSATVNNKLVRVSGRRNLNPLIFENHKFYLSEGMAIESIIPQNKYVLGVITKSTGTSISVDGWLFDVNSNSKLVNLNGEPGNITDFVSGNYALLEISNNFIVNAYRFNSTEVIGRATEINADNIVLGGISFKIGDVTFFRGQGNQAILSNTVLRNSVVKVVTMHGSQQAFKDYAGITFPTSSSTGTVARYVYVLDGPGVLSTEDASNVSSTIYPNPTSNSVTIATTSGIQSTVVISTMLGETVLTKNGVDGSATFQVGNLPIGQYVVKVSNQKGNTVSMLQVIR